MNNFRKNGRTFRFLLILPEFQLLLIGVNLLVTLGISAIIWFTTRSALLDLKPAAGLSGLESQFFKTYLDYQIHASQMSMLFAIIGGVVLSTTLTLILSHRIAGPLVRLRNHFRMISDGKNPVPHLEFRDGDFLRDIPPLVNRAIDHIQNSQGRDTVNSLSATSHHSSSNTHVSAAPVARRKVA